MHNILVNREEFVTSSLKNKYRIYDIKPKRTLVSKKYLNLQMFKCKYQNRIRKVNIWIDTSLNKDGYFLTILVMGDAFVNLR